MTFELLGAARLRAGVKTVVVDAESLGCALRGLATLHPELAGSVVIENRVHPAYRLNLNGLRFISDSDLALTADDTVLLLSADVGG